MQCVSLTMEPTCRMMMPPAFTGWPPKTLTPRLFATESRPFLVEPEPFFWAFSTTRTRLLATGAGAKAQTLRRAATELPAKVGDNILASCRASGPLGERNLPKTPNQLAGGWSCLRLPRLLWRSWGLSRCLLLLLASSVPVWWDDRW